MHWRIEEATNTLCIATVDVLHPAATQVIDHIVHSTDLRASELEAWAPVNCGGVALSDHTAVRLRLGRALTWVFGRKNLFAHRSLTVAAL